MTRPEILATPTGPAVTHSSDFSLVTASKPAMPGEILSLFAAGLGPARGGVDPGKPFPTDPLAVVNSPVEVMVDGRPAEVLAAVGYPGTLDRYQVNFRIPADAAPELVAIQRCLRRSRIEQSVTQAATAQRTVRDALFGRGSRC